MQPSLQEIGLAAIRDIDARRAKKRVRRAGGPAPGGQRPNRANPARADVPLAAAFQSWQQAAIGNRAPVAAPAPHKRYLILGAAGFVLMVACGFGLAWARETVGWRNDEHSRRHGALLQQGVALHGQIETYTRQAERLEEKARTLMQYATDLRYSFPDNDGSRELQQADAALADRDHLLEEIKTRRERLAELKENIAALGAP
jgi:hypothetical protein